MDKFVKVRAKQQLGWLIDKGKTYFVIYSYKNWALRPNDPPKMMECWHIYVAENKDAWLCNCFDRTDFNNCFEEVE